MHPFESTRSLHAKPVLLAGAAMACALAFPQQASADTSYCTTGGTGDIEVTNCSTRVDAQAKSGDTSLDVNGITLEDGNINYNPSSTAEGPLGMTLTVENSTVNSTDYGGININSFVENTDIDVTLAEDVNITSTAGFGGVWTKSNISGDITVKSAATVDATNADGINAVTNNGAVTITNSGQVTSHTNRGLYADGNHDGSDPAEVKVSNSGTVSAYEAGIRVIDYNGTAKIENSGEVTSTTKQALIAWSPKGDVEITNSGKLSAVAGTGLQGASQNGDVRISNSNSIDALQGINAAAGFDTDETGWGDVTVENSARVTATGTEGIYAFSQKGDIEITNSGDVTGATDGISAESWEGTVAIGNSGTVKGLDGVRTGAATTTITNSGTIEGTDSAVNVGSGATTLVLEEGSVLKGDLTIGTGSLAIDPALDTSLDNVVAGGGTLIKQGAARLTLTGDSSDYAGNVNVTEGVFELTGQLGSGEVSVGGENGASAEVTGEDAQWINTGNFQIGTDAGGGDVTVSGGARVETSATYVGPVKGSLTVEGEGTTWFSENGAQVSRNEGSTGTLIVQDGATFETSTSGLYAGKGSDITITGAGSKMLIGTLHPELPADWNAADGWFSMDEGKTLVSDGGLLQADGVYIGGFGATLADMTVTGADSKLVSQLSLYVGGSGNGTVGHGLLTIADGAKATAYTAAAGVDEGSEGKVLITGEGSSLEVLTREGYSGNMRVGFDGNATVIVQDGGLLKAANVIDIATGATATGTLVVGAEEGEDAAAAGMVEAANGIYFGEGDATLVFNHTGDDLEFGNVMFGTGGEIRQLAGVTDLTADSPDFFGTVDVMGGLLKANGDLSGAAVTVADGGALGGAGTIGSLVVQDGGTLAPGNSPGTLTITGDVTLESGSSFDVEISGAQHDAILVETGNVTIADGAVLNPILTGPLLDNPYDIIQLGEGSTGQIVVEGDGFVLAEDDLPLLEGVIGYEDGGITLTYQGISSPWSALVSSPNQGAAANAVQALGSGNALYAAATLLGEAGLAGTFDSLSGEIHASLKTALIEDSRMLRSAAMDRASDLETGTGLWATGFGNWGSTDGNANAASIDRDTAGVFMGADMLLGGWRVGVLAGYSNTDIDLDARASSAESDNYHLGLYAGGGLGPVHLRAGLSHSWHNVSTTRNVTLSGAQTLAADYDAGTTQVFGELGYNLGAAGFDVEPFAGLAYVSLKADDYAETGGAAALTGGDMTSDVTFSTLGLRGSAGLGGLAGSARIKGTLAWLHAFGDRTPVTSHAFGSAATPFTVSGVPVAEDAALAEIGLEVSLAENIRLNVGYKGQFGSGTTDHAATGGLSVRF